MMTRRRKKAGLLVCQMQAGAIVWSETHPLLRNHLCARDDLVDLGTDLMFTHVVSPPSCHITSLWLSSCPIGLLFRPGNGQARSLDLGGLDQLVDELLDLSHPGSFL